MENKTAHTTEGSSDKRIAFLGILVVIIGIITGIFLIQQRLTLKEEAAEINKCPNNKGKIDCFFEYKTYFESGYVATLSSNNETVEVFEGTLPNTNGIIANETASFLDQPLGKTYKCTIVIKTVCEEKIFTVTKDGEDTCDADDPSPEPSQSPTPSKDIDPICTVNCACEDIFAGITRYPTYYPNQPGLEDGKIIIPKDAICVNCSSLVMKERSTGIVITQAVTATPDPNEPGKKACLNEDNKDIEKEGFLEFRCHQAKAGTGGQDETCRTYTIEMTNTYEKTVCDKDNGDQETTSKSCSFECKSCCPSCSEPQPMMVGKKVGKPKAGVINPDPEKPTDWEWELKVGESCSDDCNFAFELPPLGLLTPPFPGFGKGNEWIGEHPRRGDPVTTPAPRCIAAGQPARIVPTAPDGGWIVWDEFDFTRGQPVPTSQVPLPGGRNEHNYTDPGVYDITLTCKRDTNKDGTPDELEQCIKRIAVTCPGGGGGGGGGDGEGQCYDQCTSDSDCGTGMVCHKIPGKDYSRCVKNPEDSCEDNQSCLCQDSCPVSLPKPTGVCQ